MRAPSRSSISATWTVSLLRLTATSSMWRCVSRHNWRSASRSLRRSSAMPAVYLTPRRPGVHHITRGISPSPSTASSISQPAALFACADMEIRRLMPASGCGANSLFVFIRGFMYFAPSPRRRTKRTQKAPRPVRSFTAISRLKSRRPCTITRNRAQKISLRPPFWPCAAAQRSTPLAPPKLQMRYCRSVNRPFADGRRRRVPLPSVPGPHRTGRRSATLRRHTGSSSDRLSNLTRKENSNT